MSTVVEKIAELGVVPVVALESERICSASGKSARRGGLPCAEVTFPTAAAETY